MGRHWAHQWRRNKYGINVNVSILAISAIAQLATLFSCCEAFTVFFGALAFRAVAHNSFYSFYFLKVFMSPFHVSTAHARTFLIAPLTILKAKAVLLDTAGHFTLATVLLDPCLRSSAFSLSFVSFFLVFWNFSISFAQLSSLVLSPVLICLNRRLIKSIDVRGGEIRD